MKKIIFVLLFFSFFQTLYAKDIYFYVASSMAKPAAELTEKFNLTHKNKAVLITGGSGQLLNKILMSKKADIYIAASQFFLNKAKDKGIVIMTKDLLYQIPVFGLSKNNTKKISSFKDIYSKKLKIALGRPETMALGKIYLEIENKFPENIKKKILENKAVEAVNVSQIVNYLKSNVVDAGILFDSAARANNLKYVEIPKDYNKTEKVSVALLNLCKNRENAKELFDFIFENKNIFKKFGFNLMQNN